MPNVRQYPVGVLELMKLGRVWIIESLPEGHLRTGNAIREHLEDIFNAKGMDVPVTYRVVSTTAEFMGCLDELLQLSRTSPQGVMLDIETHGLDDFSGLQLRDGSNVSWGDLKPILQAINMATRFNLFLVMAACFGAFFGQTARLEEVSVVSAYVGPTETVATGALLDGHKTLFSALFEGLDISDALTAIRQQWPALPYLFLTALGLFRWGAEGYLRDYSNPKRLRDRARAQIDRLKAAHRPDIPSINELVRRLEATQKPYMERAIRTYFALDQFPGNAQRFPIDYWTLYREATKR
jgi:hypothetical protein